MNRRAFRADRAAASTDPALRPLTTVSVSDGIGARGHAMLWIILLMLAVIALGAALSRLL